MDTAFLATDLRRADPNRHLLSLFAPMKARKPLWALFLLNHEITRTRSTVTDTNLGLIRLQWWREHISRVYDGGDGGQIPVLSTLAPLIHQDILPMEWFDALLYAREFDLEDLAPETLDGLKNYCDFTTTPLNQLALKIIGENAEIDEIRHISVNFGLLETVRSVPFMVSQGRCYIPQDMLKSKNLTSKMIIDFNHKSEIVEILRLMKNSFSPYRRPESRFLKFQQRMTSIYLDQLKKNGFDVFSSKIQTPPAFLALRILLSSRS